jgi:hypothetical protein
MAVAFVVACSGCRPAKSREAVAAGERLKLSAR